MRWIQRSMQLGQAVKNVGRLRQIIGVFSKYGFLDVVNRMDLGKFLPSRWTAPALARAETPAPERLRLAFEELGPTFVKLGQLLSTRPDLVPDTYIEEFTKLQDNVQPLPYETVKATIESALGKKLEDAFASLDPTPLAAASIAQVHTAELKTGQRVVVKVQRPEIDRIIETDISLLAFLASLLEKYVPESRLIGPKTIVDEFFGRSRTSSTSSLKPTT
jgi:ubiquinone biosynthesis protein